MALRAGLNGLQAFEAAARLGGIGRAAEELGVTSSAVSHRIAALERQLGLRLFARARKGLSLTREGARLAGRLEGGFRQIEHALGDLLGERAGALRISVLETFALYWLSPRLGKARAMELSIDSGQELADFGSGAVDAAIRLGHGRWEGLEAERLFDDVLALLARPGMQAPERVFLSRHRAADWAEWSARFGHAGALPVAWVDSSSLAIKAAADGAGICLASLPLAASEIAAGRLSLFRPELLESGCGAYWLVYPRLGLRDPRLRAFQAWLLSEARAAGAGA